MTAINIIEALSKRYAPPEYAFLTEVRNSVGFQSKVRTADAMAMSLWPSRGLYMTGFEVKVSRADWKKELRSPEKAEELARYCKHWFVACPENLIPIDEVPSGWGLISVGDGGKLKYLKPAPELPSTQEPTWILFASLMRDVVENWTPKSLTDKRVEQEVSKIRESLERSRQYEKSSAEKRASALTEAIHAFEAASGIKIDQYSDYFNGEIGRAVASIRHWKATPTEELAAIQARIRQLGNEVDEAVRAVEKVVLS